MPSHDVLLVEDDPPTRARLASVIESQPHLVLASAVGTCRDAREALERREPAVLLTDLGLPDGDGMELAALARGRAVRFRL